MQTVGAWQCMVNGSGFGALVIYRANNKNYGQSSIYTYHMPYLFVGSPQGGGVCEANLYQAYRILPKVLHGGGGSKLPILV